MVVFSAISFTKALAESSFGVKIVHRLHLRGLFDNLMDFNDYNQTANATTSLPSRQNTNVVLEASLAHSLANAVWKL